MSDVWKLYENTAPRFDRLRGAALVEAPYLREMRASALRGGVLDLGCGAGVPIARYFVEAGCAVTGVDAAPAMIALSRRRFPAQRWIAADMRGLALDRRFGAILAWDSFFHLPAADQRAMFAVFRDHAAPDARLLINTGDAEGVAIGDMFGRPLHHWSLEPEEYRALLAENGFRVLRYGARDPACGWRTVWLAAAEA